jgi:hypothetical protein
MNVVIERQIVFDSSKSSRCRSLNEEALVLKDFVIGLGRAKQDMALVVPPLVVEILQRFE